MDAAIVSGAGANPDITSIIFPANAFDVRVRNSASIDVGSTCRDVRNFDIGTNSTAATVTHTAGNLRITNRLLIGTAASASATSYTVSGGTLIVIGGADVDVQTGGAFHIEGQAATLSLNVNAGAIFSLIDTGTLSYTLGANGVSPLNLGSGTMEIGTPSRLTIDASAYTAGAGTIPLAAFGSRSGEFSPANVTVTGLAPGLSGSVDYTSTSMSFSVVPEPSVCGIGLGLLGVGLGRIRRRR